MKKYIFDGFTISKIRIEDDLTDRELERYPINEGYYITESMGDGRVTVERYDGEKWDEAGKFEDVTIIEPDEVELVVFDDGHDYHYSHELMTNDEFKRTQGLNGCHLRVKSIDYKEL